MFRLRSLSFRAPLAVLLVIATCLALAGPAHAVDKKKKKPQPAADQPVGPIKFPFDPKTLVWPGAPALPRIHWLDYFTGQKIDYSKLNAKQARASWMDRLAGDQSTTEKDNSKQIPFQLINPFGIAVDSKGQLYVADTKVGAIFVFNTETHDTVLIRNGFEAHFALLNCLAIDDDDRLFATDGKLHHVLIFKPDHQIEGTITEGLVDPVGIAIDTDNRFLYVVDTQQDQVIVYDADTYKLLRRIGTGGKNHYLTTPGDFGAPTGVAVDKDGNIYVTDTLNNRVEAFDADGAFIRTWGKSGDGPGYFARPKGIAVDSDGHIWVADQMNDRLQLFDKEGNLLTYIGVQHSMLPGQFSSLINVAIDKKNRVYTAEQYPGRVQMFQYVTDSEALANKAKHDEELEKAAEERRAAHANKSAAPPPADAKPATDKPAEPATQPKP